MRVCDEIPFALQVGIWGAAWDGELVEVSAMLCERRGEDVPMHPWDHDAGYLRTGAIITDEGVTTLPYRYALPLAADYMIRTGVLRNSMTAQEAE